MGTSSYVLCFLALFISVSLGAPPSINKDCKGSNTENLLEKQRYYKYRYHGEATAKSVGTTDLESKIDIKCDVHIQHASHCLFQMEVKDCKLNAFEVNGQGKVVDSWVTDNQLEAITRHPIGFTLNDAEIKSVFVSEADPLFSVNMKKGIASAFILKKSELNLESPSEKIRVDVQGTCPVTITSPEPGKALVEKDMGGCYLPTRKDYHLSPMSMFWNMSFIQHVINSTQNCEVSGNAQSNEIKSVYCRERHAIMLESTHHTATAVQTVIEYKLELVDSEKKKGSSLDLADQKETGIIFEYEENSNSYHHDQEDLARRIKSELAEMTQQASKEIHVDTIRHHRNLVGLLRSSQEPLDQISESVITCDFYSCSDEEKEVAMDLYQYALVQCNTVPCMEAFADLVEKKLVQHTALNFIFMTLTNIHHVPPEYIGSVLRMCVAKNDRFCYTTLGSLVSKYNDEQHLDKNSVLPKEILDATRHLSATLGSDCSLKKGRFPPGVGEDKKLDYMMTIIKSIGNMGDVYRMADSSVSDTLGRCARNNELSPAVAVSAIEAYRKMSPVNEIATNLLQILEDETASVELRLASYEVLVANFDSGSYREALIVLLKSLETNSQVRGYLASEFRSARTDGIIKAAVPKSHVSKRSLPSEIASDNELSGFDLNSIPILDTASSRKRVREDSMELDFLPKGYDILGGRLETEVIFNTLSSFPESIRGNLSTELFGKVFQFLEVGVQTGGWENVISQIKTMILTLKEPSFVQYTALIMQTLAQNRPTSKRKPSSAFEPRSKILLDKTIEESIQKLRDTYKASQKSLPIYFVATLRMLGNDLGFLSYEDMFEEVKRTYAAFSAGPRKTGSRQILTISETRVLDVIEAYHQFPTIMGLPLNWTTNASLALSLRGGLKMDSQQAAILHLYPTAALTFLNRMVLDLPTITDIGVQANSSAYSATEFDLTFALTKGMGAKVSLNADNKMHKPLELFRTNQMIKGGRYVEIADFDVRRVTETKCHSQTFERLSGLRCCVDRTYANVTNQIKPWFPMAASAKMSFHCVKSDSELNAWSADILYEGRAKSPEKKLKLELSAPGANGLQRNVPIEINMNRDTKEFSLVVSHSDEPDFKFRLEREKTGDDDQTRGYKSSLKASFEKDRDFEVLYERQVRLEKREDVPANRNISPKVDSFEAKVSENELKVKTPYNHYRYHAALHHNPDNDKADIHFSYENKDPSLNLVAKILPPIFFENDHKASIRLSLNCRHPQKRGKGGTSRQMTGHLTIPYSVIEVSAHTVKDTDRIRSRINITKTERKTGNLLTFLNATANLLRKTNNDIIREVGDFNVTIPRHSWSLHAVREDHGKGQETLHLVELTRAKMVPKEESYVGSFLGWWHNDHKDAFNHHELKVLYEQKLKYRKGTENDLTDTVKEAINTEYEPVAGKEGNFNTHDNQVVVADVRLSYPFDGKQETVDFNGTFKFIATTSPSQYTFAKDFTMLSTLHNIRLDSTTGFVKPDRSRISLVHSSHLTNTATGKNQGNYKLRLQKSIKSRNCALFKMNHAIDAHWWQFSSDADLVCNEGQNPPPHTLRINIDNVSPYLPEFDFKLKQIFQGTLEGGEETMNLTGHLMDIAIVGEWSKKPSRYHKKAVFTSKLDTIPSTVFEINGDPRKAMKVVIQAPDDQKISRLTVEREVINDGTGFDYSVSHNELGSPKVQRDLDLRLQIVSPRQIVVAGNGDTKLAGLILEFLLDRVEPLTDTILDKLSNPDNELNVNLSPALGGTAFEYIHTLAEKGGEIGEGVFEQVRESVSVMSPIYDPILEILKNVANEVEKMGRKTVEVFRTKTYLGWAYHYFEIPELLKDLEDDLPETSVTGIKKVVNDGVESTGKYKFREVIDHPFEWESLYQLPHFKTESMEASFPIISRALSLVIDTTGIQRMPQARIDEKIGMIYGPNGVLTFDGKLYRAPSYPSEDCAFLLAHDVRGKTFSVLTTKNKIHVIFPEMSVSIDPEGRVFVNATPSDSSKPRPLPITSANNRISVYRVDGETVAVESPNLRIRCDVKTYHCVLFLGSLHHAGTMGLMGNADGEPENDFMGPKGENLADPVQMAQAYELSRQPICQRLSPTPEPDHVSADTKATCELGLKKAKLSLCALLSRLNQNDVHKSCQHDIETSPGNQKAKCATIDAIVNLCSYHNIKGQGCERCEGVADNQDENAFRKPSEPEVDLVLIVEENKNVLNGGAGVPLKGVETLISNIEETFQGDQYNDFRLAVVGFGGQDGVERTPHLQTLGGDPWMTTSNIPEILKTLKFDGTTPANTLEAIRFANDALSFRPTASRIFVLFALNEKEKEYSGLEQLPAQIQLRQLKIVQEELNQNEVTLYTFSSFPTIAKGKKVYGLRADGFIFPQNGGEAYMDYPKSVSSKLTSATKGSIFLSSFVEENQNAYFFYAVSEEILAKVKKEKSKCKKCQCTRNFMYNLRTKCHSVDC